MNRLLCAVIFISILALGCKKNTDPDYTSLILGTWVNIQTDNKPILTDASFVIGFRSDKVETYASGVRLDSLNKTWIENNDYKYSVDGDRIIIDGFNDAGNKFHMEFKILNADEQTLSYSVSKFMIDNVEFPDKKTYTCKRLTTDLGSQLIGTWYGKSTTIGTADTSYHYWNYFAGGYFDYYYRDGSGNWINKPDNEGEYFLYGNLLASNFTNDLISGGKGLAFECWNISIEGETMLWTGLRENGVTTSFRMVRVPGPPAFH
jgi:hypothetical protein